MVSGITLILGLGTRMSDPCVYVVLWAPDILSTSGPGPPNICPKPWPNIPKKRVWTVFGSIHSFGSFGSQILVGGGAPRADLRPLAFSQKLLKAPRLWHQSGSCSLNRYCIIKGSGTAAITHTHRNMYIYIYTHICIQMYTYMYIYIHLSLYIYIYLYIHTHIHI